MESDTNCQELIAKYKMCLESEKRRLTPTDPNLNVSTTDSESISETTSSQNSFSCLQEKQQEHDKGNNALDKSESVINPEGVLRGATPSKERDIQQQAKMEQWITDSFYTSFPSFKLQEINKKALADDRREDYKKYLSEISNQINLNAANSSRSTEVLSKPTVKTKIPTRDQLLSNHSDLSYNFHNPDAIQERNEKIVVERARRKVELQQELLRQIEEKKLEIQKIRAKEKEEDEQLQRRIENQIKALQVAEESTKTKTERVLIPNPVNKISRSRDTIPRRDLEYTTEPLQSENDSPEDRRKRSNDRQIYKFFSNSAPQNYYYNHPVGFNHLPFVEPQLHHFSTAIHNSNQQCNNCRRDVPILCNSCSRNEVNPLYYSCYRCNLLQNMDICHNCRRDCMHSWSSNGFLNPRGLNIYQRDNRPQILEIKYHDNNSQTQESWSQDSMNRIKKTVAKSPDTNGNLFDDKPVSSNHSTATNSSQDHANVSISKEEEIKELKRKNDILIAKYARNYGSLRKRMAPENNTNRKIVNDSFPLPLMRKQPTTTSSEGVDKKSIQKSSQAVRNLEYKWEIPVVQKQVITSKPGESAQVFTQIGAISKQLQIEKLNFNDN
ncbi:hypothetical protein Bhyg_14803 [Pseudolycoriella hygida]|uniref:Uncharacterized protein n=1 Tax=Pseudolycoriella hygida TaxID=35572 RepID=A0A9Q0MQN9_9DIPT|nr:hypothetical protein Bhyg_14803 [Pseudolycoriella hygida]